MKPSRIASTLTLLICLALATHASETLWQIGKANHSATEFALAPANYTGFLEHFGKPDHAFYVGLSKAKTDWPYILPGPFD
ncbi:MAG TPA: polysaccharide lyase family protein, partial [Candidatus Binatia bacterium]|nr:polysaccharide lyase family protein [Candidatus Binatia bacterium]